MAIFSRTRDSHTNKTKQQSNMAHPTGITANLVGTECCGTGRTCEGHPISGVVFALDVVVRIRVVQVEIEGQEEQAACH